MEKLRIVLGYQHNRAKADNKGEDVEVADKAGGHKHRFTRLFGIGHGKEAHQNMRQTVRTEHQGQPQRNGVYRVFHQAARRHNGSAFFMHFGGFFEHQFRAEVGVFQHHNCHKCGAGEQHNRLDDLHPRGGQHTAKQHISHHQHAHNNHRPVVIQAKQQLNQLARPHHLRNQIQRHHQQSAGGRKHAHRRLFEPVGRHIGKGEFAQIAQTLGNQKQHNRPAHQKAGGVNQTVKAGGIHHRGNAQKRRCRHIIARNRQAVAKAGNAAARGVKVFGRLGLPRRPISNIKRAAHKNKKHNNGRQIQSLFFHRPADGIRRQRTGRSGQGHQCP